MIMTNVADMQLMALRKVIEKLFTRESPSLKKVGTYLDLEFVLKIWSLGRAAVNIHSGILAL